MLVEVVLKKIEVFAVVDFEAVLVEFGSGAGPAGWQVGLISILHLNNEYYIL